MDHIDEKAPVSEQQISHLEMTETGAPVQEVDTADLETQYQLSIRTYFVLFVMGLAWGTCTLGNVGPATTYSYAVADLGGADRGSWIPNAALFPLIGLQPMWGALGDRFGKKWFVVAGGLFGVAGNVVAGKANSIDAVIGGQALNGIAASLVLLALPASMEIVSAKNRPWVSMSTGCLNGSMAIFGLIEAGAFAKMSLSGWRWVYNLNAIFFGLTALLVLVLYKPPPTLLRRENTVVEELRSLDLVGTGLLLLGVVGIVTSLTWGGNAYAWSSAQVISLLVIGLVSLVGFGLYETFGRKDGLIDHRFLESRNFLLTLSVCFVDGMLLYGVNAFFPVEASAIFTSDPLKVNVYLLPLNLLVLVGIAISSATLGKTRHYRLILVISVFLVALFTGLLALVTPSRVAMTLIFTGFIGLGVGVTTVIPFLILTYSVPPHLIGTAGTVSASTRALGGTIGIAIFAAIFSNQMAKNLAPGVAAASLAAGLPPTSLQQFLGAFLGHVGDLASVPGLTPVIIGAAVTAVKEISAKSFRYVWIANMAIAFITGVLCLFFQPVTEKMTDHIESALENGALREKQSYMPDD